MIGIIRRIMAIVKGDRISVEYVGKFGDGEVFDSSSKHGQPLKFVAGEGMVVKGFDDAVIGMGVGEKKNITIKPEDAYGMPTEKAIQKVPAQNFPKKLDVGTMIAVPLSDGQQIPAKIVEIGEKEVTIDMNHPLAGKTLLFKIEIVDINKDESECSGNCVGCKCH